MSRATIDDSAAEGSARIPARGDTSPSFIAPPAAEVRVQVDEPRHDPPPRDVDDADAGVRREARTHLGDRAALEENVGRRVHAAGGIDHPAASQTNVHARGLLIGGPGRPVNDYSG